MKKCEREKLQEVGRKQKQTTNKKAHRSQVFVTCFMCMTHNWLQGGRPCTHPSTSSVKEILSPLWDPLSREGFPSFLVIGGQTETAPSTPALEREELLFETNSTVENTGRLIASNLPTSLSTDHSQRANLGPGGKEGKGVSSAVNIPVVFSVTELTVSV